MIKTRDTTTSRRALLAGAPVAAAAALGAGSLANGLATAMAGASEADAELLALKPEFDTLFDLWRTMSIEQTADLEEFNVLLRERTGLTRDEAGALDRYSPEAQAYRQTADQCATAHRSRNYNEEAWEPVRDRFYELADEILTHRAVTRDGLAVQARAFISSYSEEYDEEDACAAGTWNFLAGVCAFAGVPFPPY